MDGLPSPTPSLDGLDGAPQTKKRQRSASMHSAGESSSSPRRAPSQSLSRESPPHEFDASGIATPLVSEAADDGVPDILSYPPSPGPDDQPQLRGPMWQDVPAAQKTLTVQNLLKTHMEAGETWFLVSSRWMKRWRKAVEGTQDKEGPVEEQDLGPIDNSDLLDESGNLVSPLLEDEHVQFVPQALWEMFVAW
jgi:ubiquitin carboxyl-terminal hydrolase 4/11/15